MAYLFDSSSIYVLIKADKPGVLARNYTCSLARYEIGNILITEANAKKTISSAEQRSLLGLIVRTLNVMRILDVKNFEQAVTGIATRFSLSFYDASYVYFALTLGMTLVTEDNKLIRKVKNYVKTTAASELI